MSEKSRFFPALIAAFLLVSCGGPHGLIPGPQLTVLPATELPPPEGVNLQTGARIFRVGPFDKLVISVFGLPELSQTVQVDAAGHIALPLVGALDVAGRTPAEISAEISHRLATYVREPQVAVNLDNAASQVITVDGQVTQPGLYPVIANMTLIRAIASARGANEFARLDDVVIFRNVGDRQLAALYNLAAIRRGTYSDPPVYAGDVIIVGNSPARRLFRDILQASPLFVTPIVALLQRR